MMAAPAPESFRQSLTQLQQVWHWN